LFLLVSLSLKNKLLLSNFLLVGYEIMEQHITAYCFYIPFSRGKNSAKSAFIPV
jgi:hypothetical protein